eukprot:jgi/Astpho2/4290/fgenesh1_pg.00064_%23_75_t
MLTKVFTDALVFVLQLLVCLQGPSDVFVLDFDGVIVDSEPEANSKEHMFPAAVSSSALDACKEYWPNQFGSLQGTQEEELRQRLRDARPVLVSAADAMVHARLLLEDPNSLAEILASWDSVLPASLEQWGESFDRLTTAVEKRRADLWQQSKDAWVQSNKLYPGLKVVLLQCQYPWYLVTSKQPHRVSLLMEGLLGMEWPQDSPRMYAAAIPPNEKKIEALKSICEKPSVRGTKAKVHFVDDRVETCRAVSECPELKAVSVYMADWGYSSAHMKEEGSALKGVTMINLKQFKELIQWAILMGVDDGCGEVN